MGTATGGDLKKSWKFAFDDYDIKAKCDKQISLRGVEICIDTRYVINLSAYEPAIPDKAGQAQLFLDIQPQSGAVQKLRCRRRIEIWFFQDTIIKKAYRSVLKKSRKFAFDSYDIKTKWDKQISLRGVEISNDTRPSNQPSL